MLSVNLSMSLVAIFFLFGSGTFTMLAIAALLARRRAPARWAKALLVIIALLGITDCILTFLSETGSFSLDSMGHLSLASIDGVMLGLFLVLILTGQLFKKKGTEGAGSTHAPRT